MQFNDLSFLQNRVMNIGTALFFCEDKDMLPFPAYVVTALKTDDEGFVWFFISKTWNQPVSFNAAFPGKLEFYRKGQRCFLKVEGCASLVDDKEKVRGFMQDVVGKSIVVKEEAVSEVLLVKVKAISSSYQELAVRRNHNFLQQLIAGIKGIKYPFQTQLQPSI